MKLSQVISSSFDAALSHHQAGDLRRAQRGYQEILRSAPQHFDAKHLLGVIAHQEGNNELAVKLISEAIQIEPQIASAHNNLGSALLALGRNDEAKAAFSHALDMEPEYLEARYNLGNALLALRNWQQAAENFQAVISVAPVHFEAWNNLGNARYELGEFTAALTALNECVALTPDYAIALFNRANTRLALLDSEGALADIDSALALDATNPEFWRTRGDVLRKGPQNHAAAIESYQRALDLQPTHLDTLVNKALSHDFLKQYPQEIECLEAAHALTPADMGLYLRLVLARMRICRWDGLEESIATLIGASTSGDSHMAPLCLLHLTDSAELEMANTRLYQTQHASKTKGPRPAPHLGNPRIKIAYISEDLRDHPVGRQIVHLLECHDRSQFEIYAIYLAKCAEDDVKSRIRKAVDHCIDLADKTDSERAQIIRSLKIDIAVDLNGYTGREYVGVFMAGCAPVQLSFLGYPGTSGGDFIDYLIADRTVVPQQARPYYSEQIAYMPHSMMPGDATLIDTSISIARAELGLPEGATVFRCYNQTSKFLPETFDCWMRILKGVPGSVLWLSKESDEAVANLCNEAVRRGVDAGRLFFTPRTKTFDELAAQNQLADLFLDTYPYGAHSTGNGALWSGLPVLTRMGTTFASRVCASQLIASDLAELVTTTADEYVETAIRIATQPAKLSEMRDQLKRSRATSKLFDTKRFARDLESAFKIMHSRACSGLPKVDFDVACLVDAQSPPAAVEGLGNYLELLAEAESHLQRGLRKQALSCFEAALEIVPSDALLRRRIGDIYSEFGDHKMAAANYEQLVLRDGGSSELMIRYLGALFETGEFSKALAAIKNRGVDPLMPGQALYIQMRACIWQDFDLQCKDLVRRVMHRNEIADSMSLLSFMDDPALHLRAAQNFAKSIVHGIEPSRPRASSITDRKMRIGYFSADFRNHVMAHQMAEFYDVVDRTRFEHIAFSLGGPSADPWRRRLEASFDTFLEVSTMSDEQIAGLAREMNIDVAVDLAGNTFGCRPGIFAHRCAPVQLSYLAYPGTAGNPHVEYMIADRNVVPVEMQQFYTEKMLYLDRSFMVNDEKKAKASDLFTRAEFGLPESGFVFRCYNNSYKILPAQFACWMRLLSRVPGSVLWLLDRSVDSSNNLRAEAAKFGIDPARLIFSRPLATEQHLARNRLADLFLDTFPYTAHSTGCDALWSGLPLLTRMGDSFASRVAGSLLLSMDLPELVTYSPEEYEARALHLATHPEELSALRKRLELNTENASLFSTRHFARRMERAYVMTYERHLRGLPPDHMDIQL